ncbi:MAG: BON domain-containing protein [Alphaproteobacteria bacterium]|nr:BON domain-containing protein [Alphaproteobacteria bacterium]
MNKNIKIALSLSTSLFLVTGCLAPLVIGGGAAVGTLAVREKGVTGTMSDSQISMVIKAKLYSYNTDLHARVTVNVEGGEVLLTGSVQNQEWPVEAERIAWEASGVKKVLNNIEVVDNDDIGVGIYAQDSWITTQLKSKLLFGDDIRSLNYSLKTVGGVAYILGVAQSKEELDKVLDIASKTSGVTKVVNYTRVRGEAE